MSARDNEKYYWLKLPEDFFKRHDIQYLEKHFTNGEKYVLFYLKLMCESISHGGELRFNEFIPYDYGMLSAITNTDIDTVKSAMELLENLKMVEVYDNGTYYLEQVQKFVGCETGKAQRMREYRERLKEVGSNEPICSLEIEQEIDIEIDKVAAKYKEAGYENESIDYVKELIIKNNIKQIGVAFDKGMEILENTSIINKNGYFREVAEREGW